MWCNVLVCIGCGHGSLRLSGSESDNLGRLDICLNNVWGTICQNGWGDVDSRVACRQLGFAAAGKTFMTLEINLYILEMLLTL